MRPRVMQWISLVLLLAFAAPLAAAEIPEAAWKRPLGQPLENPGKKKPALDAGHIDDGYWNGAPVGGFGAGTFSRTYRGDFARWHLKAGAHKYQTVAVNQFSVYQKPDGGAAVAQVLFNGKPDDPGLSGWTWEYPVGAGDYYALYPKSWFDYRWEKFPVRLTVEQFSPILPNNYKETSYPVAVYRWKAHNPTKQRVTVGIMLTWANMIGWFRDFTPGFGAAIQLENTNRARSEKTAIGTVKGIVFDRARLTKVTEEWDGQMAIAAAEVPGVQVTYHTQFSPLAAQEPWQAFSTTGKLGNSEQRWASGSEPVAGALAVTFTIEPGATLEVPMVIAWDLPVVQFGGGRKWHRKYTDFFGTSGTNAWAIAKEALRNADVWSAAIDQWQAPFVNDESKPLWYRGMLFNETYILADGGSFWGREIGQPKTTPATFSFLECFDYPYYATLDVRFYGSLPLARFWPEIDKQVMRQFADTVNMNLTERYLWQWSALVRRKIEFRTRKARGAVPHDLGNPQEDPFANPNQFSWQDVNRWKDLNSKFVLLIWRDYVWSGSKDTAFLRYTWPAVKQAMQYLRQFDTNGDGLIENEGFPDQTYDTWPVHGESAYCGSLYLAALRASEEIARRMGEPAAAAEYRKLFERAQKAYVSKLWNGDYFNYDTASEYKNNIQSEQLAGQWYATMTGLGDLVPAEMRKSAMRKVYNFNVLKFGEGKMGAVNGIGADGKHLTGNEQVREVWGGATFGVAGLMLSEGLREEAFNTAFGIYHVVYERYGYWFRTPEAWDEEGFYRASIYMRPAAVWALEMTAPPKPAARPKAAARKP